MCVPAAETVHVTPEQDPSGAIENVALDVTSPVELPYASRPSAVYLCDCPTATEAEAGESTR